jgi:hypothetical protein
MDKEPILQFFSYDHLPEPLRGISMQFHDLAHLICGTYGTPPMLPRNPERTVALRKLLEAKDAAVRAAIYV